MKIIRPVNKQYFPIRLPVGGYIIEPSTIKKAPNGIEKTTSRKITDICIIGSFIKLFSPYRHNG
ncbi:MAG: hypothetical protein ACFFDN_26370 [Candidatus Hodarchaeota archaeon]